MATTGQTAVLMLLLFFTPSAVASIKIQQK